MRSGVTSSGGLARAQAIEEVARACKLPYLLLCSTDDPDVKATWTALGFLFTTAEVRAPTHLSLASPLWSHLSALSPWTYRTSVHATRPSFSLTQIPLPS